MRETKGFTNAEKVVAALSGSTTTLWLPKRFAERHLACCEGERPLPRKIRHWNETCFTVTTPMWHPTEGGAQFIVSDSELYHVYSDILTFSIGGWRDRRLSKRAGKALHEQLPDIVDRVRSMTLMGGRKPRQ